MCVLLILAENLMLPISEFNKDTRSFLTLTRSEVDAVVDAMAVLRSLSTPRTVDCSQGRLPHRRFEYMCGIQAVSYL